MIINLLKNISKIVIKINQTKKPKTIKSRILELLTEKELNALEISSDLSIPKENLWSYLSILKNENKIIIVNEKKPYKYSANTPKALLKRLYDFMSNENKCMIKNFQEKDLKLVQTIKEMIK